jgi:hypothetical protein
MLVAECNTGGLGLVCRQIELVADAEQKSAVAVDAGQVGNRTSDQSKIGVQLKAKMNKLL